MAAFAREDLLQGKRRRLLMLAARKVMALVGALGVPVRAWADPEIYGSENLVRHLGFEPVGNRVFEWRRA
jgi:hypothetical protein